MQLVFLFEKEKLEKNFLRAIGAKSSLAELREKYPNMGRPWSKDDDALLAKMFGEKKKNGDIAKHFGRKPGAIRSRLGHLGLIPNFWKPKKK